MTFTNSGMTLSRQHARKITFVIRLGIGINGARLYLLASEKNTFQLSRHR